MTRLRVKEVAQQKGFSMRRLTKDAGVAYNTIRTIYKDPYRPVTMTTLKKIAAALQVPVSALLEEVPEDTNNH
jgi:DNA-binding Xre family transcriptional regulator